MNKNYAAGYSRAADYPLEQLHFYPDPENYPDPEKDFQLGWNAQLTKRHTEASDAARPVTYSVTVEIESYAGPGETLDIFSQMTRGAAKKSSLHIGRMRCQTAAEGEWS